MSKTARVEDGQVITMKYTLKVDGEVIDTSEGSEPFEFIQGTGNIIPGLAHELYGMRLGESKEVVVAAEQGYGLVDDEACMDVPREKLPPNVSLEVGTHLELQDQAGRPMVARIDRVGEKTIRLDFNHPLAGKELHFSVEIAGLRPPTDEELEHGHVHTGGHEH